MEKEDYRRYKESLLVALKRSGVKFIRYAGLDVANTLRSKTVPIQRLLDNVERSDSCVVIAETCFGGFTGYADLIIEGTGCTAASVLVLKPDWGSVRILPHAPTNALVLCSLHDQETGEASPFCARSLLKSTMDKASREFGISLNVGAEIEFCIMNIAEDHPTSVDKCVFSSMVTMDERHALVDDMVDRLQEFMNIRVEQLHSESAPGQIEVVLEYQTNPLQLADQVIMAREVIQNCCKQHGYRALFLPKVFPDQAGNGLHLHLSLSDSKTGLKLPFADASAPHGISPTTGSFMAGILELMPALMGLTMPSTNSFRRVGPGCWTGSSVSWAVEDKESPLRVCRNASTRQVEHVEYKFCDSTANIFLAIGAIMEGGMHGIRQTLSLGPPSMPGTPSLATDLSSALEGLTACPPLMEFLGPRLLKSFKAVKEAEINITKDMSLEEEIALVLSKT